MRLPLPRERDIAYPRFVVFLLLQHAGGVCDVRLDRRSWLIGWVHIQKECANDEETNDEEDGMVKRMAARCGGHFRSVSHGMSVDDSLSEARLPA